MAKRYLFTDGWEFQCVKVDDIPCEGEYASVELPHDWQIYDTSDLYQDGDGWYRRTFVIEKKEDLRYRLYFEGVYMDCTVWVNDCVVGEWKYGYSSFYFDVTEAIREGENTVKVCCRFRNPNSRWYSGAGIYRNVWFCTFPRTHILQDGLYVSARQRENREEWNVEIDVEVQLAQGKHSEYELCVELLDESGVVAARTNLSCVDSCAMAEKVLRLLPVKEDGAISCRAVCLLKNPRIWDIDNPTVYTARVSLCRYGEVLDVEETIFGCRICVFLPEQGFLLNGRKVKLNGVCEHHDLGALGAAFYPAAMKRKLTILRKMGVNSLRTSHNMPAPELLAMTDQMGILVIDESFDMWERSKTEHDYARFFKEWVDRDVAAWVRRDRNHPSVIMWSIGNEIYDTHANEQGARITRELMERVSLHDGKQNARPTIASNYMQWENAQNCADVLKIAGYNYAERLYTEHHREHPDWVIYGSETSSTVQSRGIYHFPLEQPILKDEDEQCSSLGNSTVGWGAKSTDYCIAMERDYDFSMGQFLWTGFDYIGEPTPYQTKNSYFGQIDTAGFPKDSFYRYQAEWTDYKKTPMVHVFPYWDFNEEQLIDVRVVSNAPLVELFVNGVSKGQRRIDHKHDSSFCADWRLPYHKGSLLAVAYDKDGKEIARAEEHSFEDAAALIIESDREELHVENDLAFLTISAKDKDGYPVRNANNRVQVKVEGAGRLVGLDNGDSTDYDSYKGSSRRLFSGKLLAIIAPFSPSGQGDEEGEIRVTVTSKGLASASLTLAMTGKRRPIYYDRNTESTYVDELPIRKIELSSPKGQQMNKERQELVIEAKVYPKDATYHDLEWKVMDAKGAETTRARLEILDKEKRMVKVTALGNGEFRLRAACRNGRERISQISELELSASGLKDTEETSLSNRAFIRHVASECDEIYGDSFERQEGAVTKIGNNVSLVFKAMDFGEKGTCAVRIVGSTPLEKNSIHIRFSNGSQEIRRIVEFGHCEGYEEQSFLFERVNGLQEVTFIFLPGSEFNFRDFIFVETE